MNKIEELVAKNDFKCSTCKETIYKSDLFTELYIECTNQTIRLCNKCGTKYRVVSLNLLNRYSRR